MNKIIICLLPFLFCAANWHVDSMWTTDQVGTEYDKKISKYLHIKVSGFPNFRLNYDKIKVIDNTGKEIGDLWGYHGDNEVIFEIPSGSANLYIEYNNQKDGLIYNRVAPSVTVETEKEGAGNGPGTGPGSSGSGTGKDKGKCACCGQSCDKCGCADDCDCKKEGGTCTKCKKDKSKGKGDGQGPGKDKNPSSKPLLLPKEKDDKNKDPKEESEWILYLTVGKEFEKGIVYQVDDKGRTLGAVKLQNAATGIAYDGEKLTVVCPIHNGSIVEIAENGTQNTLLLNRDNLNLYHPVKIGTSDKSILLADDVSRSLSILNKNGTHIKNKRNEPDMGTNPSVALSGNTDIYYGNSRGVALDQINGRLARAKGETAVDILNGDKVVRTIKLPPNKVLYHDGLIKFSLAGNLCVTCSDDGVGSPTFLMYDLNKDDKDKKFVKTLFSWTGDLNDFVVAPRMKWQYNKK